MAPQAQNCSESEPPATPSFRSAVGRRGGPMAQRLVLNYRPVGDTPQPAGPKWWFGNSTAACPPL